MQPVEPILVTEIFPELNRRLLELLRSLSEEDWKRPTACRAWCVKDIAAHLLDTNIRRLGFERDRLPRLEPRRPIQSYKDLVDFLNELNAQWVVAARRLSPRVLIDLLELTGRQLYEHLRTLDPFAEAYFPVAWAGEEKSAAWFDIAREYTEKWHHQQQIRDAVGAPPLTDRQHLYPVLDTFLRGLPHAYRAIQVPEGITITVRVEGEAGGDWTLLRRAGAWELFYGAPPQPDARAVLDQDTAWRLFTKGLTPEAARERVRFHGDRSLAEPVLWMVAVMA